MILIVDQDKSTAFLYQLNDAANESIKFEHPKATHH